MVSRKKKVIFGLMLFGIMFCVIEVASYCISKSMFNARGLVYDPPAIVKEDYDNYQKKLHESLGWVVARGQEHEIDAEGSRLIPAFPDPNEHQSCVSIYGDSYTFSNRTTPKESWSNQLSIRLNCRVSNFGVSGYGTDQALMRFRENHKDSAKIVLLNHFVDDIPRNVSQHWGTRFTTEQQSFQFKPRFILNDKGVLEKVPLPDFSFEEMQDLRRQPEKYLKHDYFLPGSHYGSLRFQFPYSLLVVRTIFSHSKFKAIFRGEPVHAAYYREDHPSNSLKLTAEILKAFDKEAKFKGKTPIVTVIPFSTDFDYFRKNGKWSFAKLLDMLKEDGIEVVNLGAEIEKELKGRDQHYLYAGEGHFNANGDLLIAEIIARYITTKHFK